MLSFLLSLLAIVESYTVVDKIKVSETAALQQTILIEQIAEKPTALRKESPEVPQVPIQSLPTKTNPEKKQVQEPI